MRRVGVGEHGCFHQQRFELLESSLLCLSPLERRFFAAKNVQWSSNSGKIWAERSVIAHKPQEGLHFLGTLRGLPVPHSRCLDWVSGDDVLADYVFQVVNRTLKQAAFLGLQLQPCRAEALAHLFQPFQVTVKIRGEDDHLSAAAGSATKAFQGLHHQSLERGQS